MGILAWKQWWRSFDLVAVMCYGDSAMAAVLEVLAWHALMEVLLLLQMVLVELLALSALPELCAAAIM